MATSGKAVRVASRHECSAPASAVIGHVGCRPDVLDEILADEQRMAGVMNDTTNPGAH